MKTAVGPLVGVANMLVETVVLVSLAVVLSVLAVAAWRWLLRRCEAANAIDWGPRWLNRLDGFNRLFCRRIHRLGGASIPLPATGGALLASNHISGLDPLLLIAASRRPLRFIIAREEYERWWLRWLFRSVGCIPVERSGNPRIALHAARRALEAGEVVALFPHGRIHLDHHPPRPLKRGVVWLARECDVPVVPVRLSGVRAQGMTLTAVLVPSRATIEHYPPLEGGRLAADDVLVELARLLSPETAAKSR